MTNARLLWFPGSWQALPKNWRGWVFPELRHSPALLTTGLHSGTQLCVHSPRDKAAQTLNLDILLP